jgi:hypothetical protein
MIPHGLRRCIPRRFPIIPPLLAGNDQLLFEAICLVTKMLLIAKKRITGVGWLPSRNVQAKVRTLKQVLSSVVNPPTKKTPAIQFPKIAGDSSKRQMNLLFLMQTVAERHKDRQKIRCMHVASPSALGCNVVATKKRVNGR